MRKPVSVLLLGICALASACESSTDVPAIDVFTSAMTGAKVTPTAVTTGGMGSLTITLTSDSSAFRYELSFTGLSSAATAAHIHGPAVDTVTAGILVDVAALPQGRAGTIQLGAAGGASGSFDLRSAITQTVSGDSLFKLLHAGLLYVDVHTVGNSDGEIRGQVRRN